MYTEEQEQLFSSKNQLTLQLSINDTDGHEPLYNIDEFCPVEGWIEPRENVLMDGIGYRVRCKRMYEDRMGMLIPCPLQYVDVALRSLYGSIWKLRDDGGMEPVKVMVALNLLRSSDGYLFFETKRDLLDWQYWNDI